MEVKTNGTAIIQQKFPYKTHKHDHALKHLKMGKSWQNSEGKKQVVQRQELWDAAQSLLWSQEMKGVGYRSAFCGLHST